jgi:hypothetical protein
VLIAPSDRGSIYGLIGGSLLTSEEDEDRFDVLLFVKVEYGRGD